jgi:hypothetical protein
MLKKYLIVSYSYLVKTGTWDLEPVEVSDKKVVPENYRLAVSEYIAN